MTCSGNKKVPEATIVKKRGKNIHGTPEISCETRFCSTNHWTQQWNAFLLWQKNIHLINISMLISVCLWLCNARVILKTPNFGQKSQSKGKTFIHRNTEWAIWIWPLWPIKAKKGRYSYLSSHNTQKESKFGVWT